MPVSVQELAGSGHSAEPGSVSSAPGVHHVGQRLGRCKLARLADVVEDLCVDDVLARQQLGGEHTVGDG
jgi:hypothetical protein